MSSKLFRAVLSVLFLLAMFTTVLPSFAADTSTGTASTDGSAAPAAATVSYKAAGSGSNGSGGDNYIFTGAATYAVPIAVPPGRLGMQPNLAIQYNSQKGNGWLGVGWDLTVASIQRNTTHGVSYAKDDFVFSSDGASGTLVSIGGNEYRMKIEDGSFMRFSYLGATSGWKVYDKSGLIYTFGSNDSGDGSGRQDNPSDSTKVFQWKLERVADTMGNCMDFKWFKTQGQIYLDRIEYTGNLTQKLSATNYVKFWYEPRTDAPETFNTLFSVKTALRLKVVEVAVVDAGNWRPVRAYQLKYDVDPALPLDQSSLLTGRSLLTSVQMFGSDVAISSNASTHIGMITDGSAMPATTFDYHGRWGFEDKGNWTDGVLNTTYANWDSAFVRVMDVNGDNRYDVVIGPGTGDNAGKWYFLESYFDKTTQTTKGLLDHGNWVANGGTAYANYTWKAEQIHVIDVNGDGRQDIVLGPTSEGEWMLLESTVNGFVARGNCLVDTNGGAAVTDYRSFFDKTDRIRVMDVNGDGHADIVVGPDPDNGNLYYLEADGSGHFRNRGKWLDTSQDYKAIWGLFNLSQIRAIDVNGDGKQDIVAGPGSSGSWTYFESSADRFVWKGNPVDVIFAYANWQNDSNRIRAMDVNGDGLQDIVIGTNGGGSWYVLLSTGNGFVNKGNWVGPKDANGNHTGSAYGEWSNTSNDDARIRVFDATGDGLQDIVIGPDGSGKWYLLESTGDGFEDRDNWLTSYPNGSSYGSWDSSPNRIMNADFDGDGMTDILLGPDGSSDRQGQWYLMRSDATHVDLLASVRNGQGGTTVFEYTPSSHYENDNMPFVMPVVSAISIYDGFGNVSTTRYEYKDGYFDMKEREFRGFGHVKQTNPDLTTLETEFHQKDGEGVDCIINQDMTSVHKGKPYLTIAKDSGGNVMSQTNMVWEYVMPLGSQYPVYSRLKQKNTTSTIGGVSVWSSEAYSYDDVNSNGMVTSVTVSGTDAETVTTTNSYQNFGTSANNFWAWRLTGTKITGSSNTSFARETTMEYYPKSSIFAGKLKYKRFNLSGSAVNPNMLYEYDAYGNVQYEYSANNTTTEYVYDTATQTLPVEIRYPQTGAVTHIVKQQYDPVFRVPKYSWDENNNKTTNWFDRFGRVTRTETYAALDGTTVSETQTQYANAVVSSNIEDVCASTKYMFRSICMAAAYFNTQFVEIDKITTPAYIGKSVLNEIKDIPYVGVFRYYISGVEYFDGLGRAVQTVSTGEDSKFVASNTLYDDMGRVKYTQGPQFVSSPAYRTVVQLQSSTTIPFKSYFYNANGSLSSTSSPHEAGAGGLAQDGISYSGLSTTVTDADGKSKTTKRDYLGRIIEVKEFSDANTAITTSYAYNAVGDLLTITNGANVTEIKYDSLGRKISMTDPDMGYWMYCYDNNGNMLRQLDPKRQMTVFEYDALNRVTTKKYYTVGAGVTVTVGTATASSDLCAITGTVNAAESPVAWTYDNASIQYGKGQLYSVSNGTSSTYYNKYDAAGRATQVTKTINGDATTYTTKYAYDNVGRVQKVIYPSDNFEVYYYYFAGSALLQSVTGSDGVTYAAFSDYNAAGSPGLIAYGNGVKTRYNYRPATFNLKAITTTAPPVGCNAANDILSKSYGFSPANDINTLGATYQVSGAQTTTNFSYGYDGLHSLKSEAGSAIAPRLPQDSLFNYASHRLMSIRTGQTEYVFDYDKNGNMTSGVEVSGAIPLSRTITWNADNMPKSITYNSQTTAFLYDGSATRVKKTGQYGTTYYIGKHFEIVNGVKTKHIFAGGLRIAQISNGVRYYHHKDHLGSTIGVTNDAGTLVWKADYEPYGLPRSTWWAQPSIDSLIRHRFTDQEYDAETKLYNYNARLYDPAIARFISPDTIVDNPYSSLALNRYMYVAGNPLRYTDPSGHIKFGKFWKRAVGSSVSTVMDDWLGVEQYSFAYYNGFGGEGSFDFRNNGVEMSGGVGYGFGASGSVSTSSVDISGGNCTSASVGYDTRNGAYVSASYYGASARYYLSSGYYSVGYGVSFGVVGVNAGYYSNGGGSGWRLGGSIGQVGATYDYGTGSWRYSYKVDIADLRDSYNAGVNSRQGNGYGPEGGGDVFKIIDLIGTIAAGWEAADNHDAGYDQKGASKAAVDFRFFRDMVSGSLGNASGTNGLMKAVVGLAISPVYYTVVAVGGGEAFSNAQRR